MFSRLVTRSGAFAPVLRHPDVQRRVILAFARCSSTKGDSDIMKHVNNWEKAGETYYGPSRDYINFPAPKQADNCPPVRMGFIPESWFKFFYEKTGVTGPYMFGTGVLAMLLSKELWVVEHGFTEFVAFWAAIFILAKRVGPGLSKYLEKQADEFEKVKWHQPLEDTKAQFNNVIADAEKSIWCLDGQKHLFESKRENVDLQLEATYRQRLAEVHQAIKKRLDYQMDLENTKRHFEQEHMVNWIVSSVVKSITPQQERDSISKCIQELKVLSAKA